MAVKGYLTIEEEEDSYRLTQEEHADFKSLANGERRISKKLFSDDNSILLDNENHELLGDSVDRLRESLKSEHERAFFLRNTGFFVIGALISFLLIIFIGVVGGGPGLIVFAIMTAALAATLIYFVMHFWGGDDDPTFRAIPIKSGST